jgi:ComF family protein
MGGLGETLAATFIPALCARCGGPLAWRGSRAGVCATCWSGVELYREPGCPCCGNPEVDSALPCLDCRDAPPAWRAATSCGPYRGALRDLVILFKARGGDDLDRPLADLLCARWRATGWQTPDLVTSVPIALLRRLRRGYNQAELLARRLAHQLDVDYTTTLRRRHGTAQLGRSRSARLRLRAAAFRPRRALAGSVLLVDDVLTTGATATACTHALLAAGADAVEVLTLARTERAGRMS